MKFRKPQPHREHNAVASFKNEEYKGKEATDSVCKAKHVCGGKNVYRFEETHRFLRLTIAPRTQLPETDHYRISARLHVNYSWRLSLPSCGRFCRLFPSARREIAC